MSLTDLTWTCHVCKEERPDRNISVLKKPGLLAGRFPVTQNIRYCNDRPSCISGAKDVSFIKEDTEKRSSTNDA